MCHDSCKDYVRNTLTSAEIEGKSVLEVGSYNFNGTARDIVEGYGPSRYVGVDVQDGPGVDQICDVSSLVSTFGEGSFDVVISTEMLEHVEDWREAVDNLKRVTAPGGILVLTTRSPGFGFHGYPADYWRFTPDDMQRIFADLVDVEVQSDPELPGVFVRAAKPAAFAAADLSTLKILSVVRRVPTLRVTALDRTLSTAWATVRHVTPEPVRRIGGMCKRRIQHLVRS